MLNTPVLFFTFNRPETTRRVFQRIREARPNRLFVVADGPRPNRAGDLEGCAAARRLTERIDWDCEVHRQYADDNLGLKRRIETGLAWVFAQPLVDEAIILEDDCLPDPTFFRFCEELIARYRDDGRVMTVSGSRFVPAGSLERPSYRFSRYPLIWGWATWRGAWQHYDGSMREWPRLRDTGWLDTIFATPVARSYWSYVLDTNWTASDAGSWDYAWLLTCWLRGGLSVHPTVNLVTNIGFGPDGVHGTDARMPGANLPADAMAFPLQHADAIVRDEAGDDALDAQIFSGTLTTLLARVRSRLSDR